MIQGWSAQRLDFGKQLFAINRLGDVITGTLANTPYTVGFLVLLVHMMMGTSAYKGIAGNGTGQLESVWQASPHP